jgi:ribosomal protein S18 acetylase RimI-like enzyme
MSNLSIQLLDPKDTDGVLWLWRRSFEHGVGVHDPDPTIDGIRGYFQSEVQPKNTVRVAKIDEAVVGVIASNQESVSALYVRVEHIGQGIGSRLIDIAKTESSGSLWLFTFARNTNARRFYARHGFIETAYGFEPFWQLDDVKLRWVSWKSAA